MELLLGLGSNVGDRASHLRNALREIARLPEVRITGISPILETEAMIPSQPDPSHPFGEEWYRPYLNLVISCEIACSPLALLKWVKEIEQKMGREAPGTVEKWAPRILDIDLLDAAGHGEKSAELKLPHMGFTGRPFVQVPLLHLRPSYPLLHDGRKTTCLRHVREQAWNAPLWMGIMNLTPDSFSDGKELEDITIFQNRVRLYCETGVQILDLGGVSTRPGAMAISPEEEWSRLTPALGHLRELREGDPLFPLISVDTSQSEIARRAIQMGAQMINDVSGLSSPEMLTLLQNHDCQYVLMHSLSLPANLQITMKKELDVVRELKNWTEEKLNLLVQKNISLDRVIFDPGIGFGKTMAQSWQLISRFEELKELPVRILLGHSRKSFLQRLTHLPFKERDWESIGASLRLAEMGADILRVHNPHLHIRAHRAFRAVPFHQKNDSIPLEGS